MTSGTDCRLECLRLAFDCMGPRDAKTIVANAQKFYEFVTRNQDPLSGWPSIPMAGGTAFEAPK